MTGILIIIKQSGIQNILPCSADEFYKLSKDERKRELQLWTWDGELKRRIYFDVPYDIYALSEDNIFYAMNMDKPDVIYTYDLNEK